MRHKSKIVALLILLAAGCATAVAVDGLGNNTSRFANDSVCDDPRFKGEGMASSLDRDNIGRDASDCARLLRAGLITEVRTRDERDISECSDIDFGFDRSDWERNDICDDPRFTGPGADDILRQSELLQDAVDCRRLCNAGRVWLR